MVLGAIIGGVASAALGFAGSQSQSNSQNQAVKKQHEYDKDVWNFNWEESERQYNFNKEGNQIARQNNENELGWREQTAVNDWAYGMKIRDYEYMNNMRQYTVGEETYKAQLGLNASAVSSAMDLENRWFHEQMIQNIYQDKDVLMSLNQLTQQTNMQYVQDNVELSMGMAQEMDQTFLKSQQMNQQQRTDRADSAFKAMDNMVAGLQAKGKARNTGNAGRSQAKAVQSVMASVGRQQAQIVDSITRKDAQYSLERTGLAQQLTQSHQTLKMKQKNLTDKRTQILGQANQTASFNREVLSKQLESAGMRTVTNRQKILQDRAQADMEAFSKRMLEPSLAPDLPVPYQLPRTIFQDPIKPKKPPKPIKGAGGASTATNLLNAGAGLASSLGSINWG